MIEDLGSYSVDRFVSFTAESYFRLFERQNASLWPLPLALHAMGVVAAVLAIRGKVRAVAILLAAAFVVVALSFHFRLYAELTPVGTIFGWACLVQAGLLLLWAVFNRNTDRASWDKAALLGMILTLAGLGLHPLLARLTQGSWSGAEYFGVAPDPTVLVALGILLIVARRRSLFVLLPVPLLWCIASGATLHALEAPLALAMPALGAAAIVGALVKNGNPATVRPAGQRD